MVEIFQAPLSRLPDEPAAAESAWQARATVDGVDYSWQSRGDTAANGLAHMLLEAGVRDQPVLLRMLSSDGKWVTCVHESLHRMAKQHSGDLVLAWEA